MCFHGRHSQFFLEIVHCRCFEGSCGTNILNYYSLILVLVFSPSCGCVSWDYFSCIAHGLINESELNSIECLIVYAYLHVCVSSYRPMCVWMHLFMYFHIRHSQFFRPKFPPFGVLYVYHVNGRHLPEFQSCRPRQCDLTADTVGKTLLGNHRVSLSPSTGGKASISIPSVFHQDKFSGPSSLKVCQISRSPVILISPPPVVRTFRALHQAYLQL